jgi:hypothetical protein
VSDGAARASSRLPSSTVAELPTPKIPLQDFFFKNYKISGGASGLLFKVSQMYLDSSFQARSRLLGRSCLMNQVRVLHLVCELLLHSSTYVQSFRWIAPMVTKCAMLWTMITLDEVWPQWPSKAGQIKYLCIMSCILTRYTPDKNLRMIQSFFSVFSFGPLVAKSRIRLDWNLVL